MKKLACTLVIAALAAPACAAAQATLPVASEPSPLVIGETFTIASKVLGETRTINVYFGRGWVATDTTPLPVMYMPDGGTAEDFIHVAGLLQVSTGNATMRPFMLVGIENTQRRRDLTGPTSNPEDRKIAPVVSGSAAFREFIRTELMPVVNARYLTTGETAIIGESLAGLFVVETFLLEPDLFDTYIAFDPSLWWDNGGLVAAAQGHLRAPGERTLYLAHSSQPDIAAFTRRLRDILDAHAPAHVTWHYQDMPAETHATIYHPAALQALRLLFQPAADND